MNHFNTLVKEWMHFTFHLTLLLLVLSVSAISVAVIIRDVITAL